MIRWNANRTFGTASLDDVRRLLADPQKCRVADGKRRVTEPAAGQIFRFSSDRKPVCVSSVDYIRGVVHFVRMPNNLAHSIFGGDYQFQGGKILVPRGR